MEAAKKLIIYGYLARNPVPSRLPDGLPGLSLTELLSVSFPLAGNAAIAMIHSMPKNIYRNINISAPARLTRIPRIRENTE